MCVWRKMANSWKYCSYNCLSLVRIHLLLYPIRSLGLNLEHPTKGWTASPLIYAPRPFLGVLCDRVCQSGFVVPFGDFLLIRYPFAWVLNPNAWADDVSGTNNYPTIETWVTHVEEEARFVATLVEKLLIRQISWIVLYCRFRKEVKYLFIC